MGTIGTPGLLMRTCRTRRPALGQPVTSGILPGIGLRRFPARTGKHLVERMQLRRPKLNLQRAQRPLKLVPRSRADDRRCHDRIVQQPGQRNIRGLFTQFVAEAFVRFERCAMLLDLPLRGFGGAPPLARLLQHPAEESSRKWAIRDAPDAIRATRRNHLEFDPAGVEVIAALLGDQAQK